MAVILREDFETAGLLAGQSPGAGMTWDYTWNNLTSSNDVSVADGRAGTDFSAECYSVTPTLDSAAVVATAVVRGLSSEPSTWLLRFQVADSALYNAYVNLDFSRDGLGGVRLKVESIGDANNSQTTALSGVSYPPAGADTTVSVAFNGVDAEIFINGVSKGSVSGITSYVPAGSTAIAVSVSGFWLHDLQYEEFTGPDPVQGIFSAPSPLGSASALGYHDFTAVLGDVVTRYVLDLVTPGGLVRVPMSSWQATLQTGRSNYVQAVVPAVAPWVASINAATEFVVSRQAVLPDGGVIEYEMARSPVGQANFSRGPQRYTCTLSGYSTGFAVDEDPPAVYDRELALVRSVTSGSSGMRVRCAVDWLLRPGHRALVDGDPFVVAYINYYVALQDSGQGDAYMDVGERN